MSKLRAIYKVGESSLNKTIASTIFNNESMNNKEFSLNPNLEKNLSEACNLLKNEFLNGKIKDLNKVRKAFEDILNGRYCISESYYNLEVNKVIPRFDFDIEDAFYTIGSELCIPRNGATNKLREAYKNDVPNQEVSFLDYQCATIEEAYKLVENYFKIDLAGNSEVDFNV